MTNTYNYANRLTPSAFFLVAALLLSCAGCASFTTDYYPLKAGYGKLIYTSTAGWPHSRGASTLVYSDGEKIKRQLVWPYLGGVHQEAFIKDVVLFDAMIEEPDGPSHWMIFVSWRGGPPVEVRSMLADGLVGLVPDAGERAKYVFLAVAGPDEQEVDHAVVIMDLNDPVIYRGVSAHIKFNYDTLLGWYQKGVAQGDEHIYDGAKYFILKK